MSVLLITEQQGGAWHNMSWECLAAAQQTSEALGVPLVAAVVGSDIGALCSEIAAKAVSEVVAADDPALAEYTPDGFTAALAQIIEKLSPTLILFPHTYQVRDFGPKLATRLGRPFLSDAIDIRVEDGQLVFVRQLFQGKMNADVTAEGDGPIFASVQSGCFRADHVKAGDAPAPIGSVDVTIDASAIREKPLERFKESKGGVDLTQAELIVSVGRGIKDPENIPVAQALADAFGAELAASRPICDNGWLPLERQVGSSGSQVTPKMYLALGISGAIQHVVGMKGSETIVAINKDESAPIFEIADYGIVGDLFELAPALVEALEQG